MGELRDQYGTVLKIGQDVIVAVAEEIAAKGEVVEINQKFKQVFVNLTWPAGNHQRWGCFKYCIVNKEQFNMSGLVVVSPDEEY